MMETPAPHTDPTAPTAQAEAFQYDEATGTYTFDRWHDGTWIQARLLPPEPGRRHGTFDVAIWAGPSALLGHAHVMLADPGAQRAMAQLCAKSDGVIDWSPRITLVIHEVLSHLRTQAAQTGVTLWAQVLTAQDLCAETEEDVSATVKDFLIPGCITVVSAPRNSGKTFVALFLGVALAQGGIFRREHLAHQRVLLVDRDNPKALVSQRMRRLGAETLTNFKVLTRDSAPPLTNKTAWERFPAEDYDVLLVDSIGAFTEGVSEKEGKQTQEFLAILKDIAARGLAILALANTNKAGTNIRGRGEQSDAVDIVYEARNMTGWKPEDGPNWWESLPEAGEHAWQANTTRRLGGAALRVGFVPTKYRLGTMPTPFILEMDTTSTPWTMSDVTEAITQEGIQAAHAHRSAERQKLDAAAQALVAELRTRDASTVMRKREAEDFLRGQGLKVRQARNILENGYNKDVHPDGLWYLREIAGEKGNPVGVYPVEPPHAGKEEETTDDKGNKIGPLPSRARDTGDGKDVPNNHDARARLDSSSSQFSISVVSQSSGVQNDDPFSPSTQAAHEEADFGHEAHGQRPKSAPLIPAEIQGETEGPLFRTDISHPAGISRTDADEIPMVTGMDVPPCAVCGRTERWDDHGVPRCVVCVPPATKGA